MRKLKRVAGNKSAYYSPTPQRKPDSPAVVIYASRHYTEYRMPSGVVEAHFHGR